MPRRPPAAVIACAAVCGALLGGALESTTFAQETVAGLSQGAVFVDLALAMVVVYRVSGMINVAQGEMATATTYVAFQLVRWGCAYWVAFPIALLVAFVFGAGVQTVLIRPVQRRSATAVVVVTVGLFVLIDGLVTWRWSGNLQYLPAPFGDGVFRVGRVAFPLQSLGTLLVGSATAVGISALFRFSKIGRGMRALADDRDAAALVGAPVERLPAIGWGIAASLGAVAVLMTAPTQFLEPTMMQPVLVYAFAAAVLGGLDSALGAIVGGLALGVFLDLGGAYVGVLTAPLRLPVAFAVLIAALVVRPAGLFGSAPPQRA